MRLTIYRVGELPDFNVLAKQFPELKARMLGYIGKTSARNFYDSYLKGQELNYDPRSFSASGAPLDRRGGRMVSYAISRNLKHVSIASYPLNFFEQGRMLRSGRREAARQILTGKYSARLGSALQFIAQEGKNEIFSEWETKWRKKGGY